MNDADQLRRALTEHRKRSKSHFPRELRQHAGRWVLAARERGLTQRAIAKQLGTKWQTLARWASSLTNTPPPKQVSPLPVSMRAAANPPTATSPTLVTPTGHRVEGLSLTQVAELLGMLS